MICKTAFQNMPCKSTASPAGLQAGAAGHAVALPLHKELMHDANSASPAGLQAGTAGHVVALPLLHMLLQGVQPPAVGVAFQIEHQPCPVAGLLDL